MKLKDFKSVKSRREFLEKNLALSLKNIGSFSLDEKNASTFHCENMIGATQIPIGVAGPLALNVAEGFIAQSYFIPLATTEAALVASVNRGCKAITESGGASVAVETVGATRGPVFKTSGIKESLQLKNWLDIHFQDLDNIARKTSSHLKLLKLGTSIAGKYVYLRFSFDTGEAMGMNMVTIATYALSQFIEEKTNIKTISLAGNFDIDKKPAWLNFISGRGKRVWAEATIDKSVLHSVLKTSAEAIYNVWLGKCLLGSFMAGSMGFNAQYANIIAALFIATGQDPAHVVEGSLGLTTTEIIDKNLYISVYLPDLMVGSLGGGTGLATQKEALSILNINGKVGDSEKLAQVCAGVVLAGELSLLASLAQGTLAEAHQRLARGT